MKILITGNMGYVGPQVAKYLRARRPNATLDGFDNAYFAHCLTGGPVFPERCLDAQFYGDVRDISLDLRGYDAVVQLAAISNDPMGNRFEGATRDINQNTTVSLGKAAAAAGVKNFVFASSCSVYGIADGPARRETDPVNPITAYAKSKIGAERELAAIDTDMTITCLVACALSRGQISVLSDGTPWRPLIDVADMARAIDWAADRPAGTGGRFLTVNAGSDDRNFQVEDLANAVARRVPGTDVSINTSAPVDSRSYKVDFGLFRSLAPDHQPVVTLDQSIQNLVDGLKKMNFKDADFRSSDLIRLKVLQDHMDTGRLNERLEWR